MLSDPDSRRFRTSAGKPSRSRKDALSIEAKSGRSISKWLRKGQVNRRGGSDRNRGLRASGDVAARGASMAPPRVLRWLPRQQVEVYFESATS